MLLNVYISVTVSMCRSTHMSKIKICNIPASIPNQSRTIQYFHIDSGSVAI